MVRDKFTFYADWVEALRILPPEDFKAAFMAMAELALYDKAPQDTLQGFSAVVYSMAERQLVSNAKRYDGAQKGGVSKALRQCHHGNATEKNSAYATEKSSAYGTKKSSAYATEKSSAYGTKDKQNTKQEEKNTNSTKEKKKVNKEKEKTELIEKDMIVVKEDRGVGKGEKTQPPKSNAVEVRATANALCTPHPQELMENRKKKFMQDVAAFTGHYPAQMLTDFFNYWTEPNKSKTKMRFEIERTWSMSLRLTRWAMNCKNDKQQKQNSNDTSRTADWANSIMQDMADYHSGKL